MEPKKLKKLYQLIILFLFCGTLILSTFVVACGQKRAKGSQSLWGGIALKAFIYKNSDGETNPELTKIAEDLLTNSKKATNQKDINIVKMDLVASAVNVSQYGASSHEEYFAEAFSKWTTATETQKNISWSLLDDFFTIVFPKLKTLNLGYLSMGNWNLVEDVLQATSAQEKYILATPTDEINLSVQDLGYNDSGLEKGLFGYKNLRYTTQVFQNILTNNNYNQRPQPLNLWQIALTNILELNQFMNCSLVKSTKRVENPKEKTFANFQDLDEYWKKLTRDETGKTVFSLKEMVDGLANWPRAGWDNQTLIDCQNQIVDLFNILFWLSQNKFPYFLINLIITPDFPLVDKPNSTLGFTSVELDNSKATNTHGYVVISAESFKVGKAQAQFNISWWSSNNRFVTLNHEMGHALDGFLGQTKAENQKNERLFTPEFYKKVAAPQVNFRGKFNKIKFPNYPIYL